MKKLVFAVIYCMFVLNNLHSQTDYKVIKVNGTIMITESGVSLAQGISFTDENKLEFITSNARAAVINSGKGRFIISENYYDLASAKSNFLPAMNNISSRAGAMVTKNDLQNHFSGNYVVLDQSEIQLSGAIFPMNEKQFFFLRYIYDGENINKMLEYVSDSLIFIKKNIYKVDGKAISSPENNKVELFYRNNNESVLISEFNLIFPDSANLKREVEIVLSEMTSKSYEEKFTEINAYINDFYGKVDIANLRLWLKENFGLSK